MAHRASDRRAAVPVLRALAAVAAVAAPAAAQLAELDLASAAGAAAAHATWRYHDAAIVGVDFVKPGADRRPGSEPQRTFDIAPHAGARDFDDGDWPEVAADSLAERRGTGRLCFGWYRLRFAVPESIAGVATAGTTLEFEVVLDDYAEVWVDGRLPRRLGQSGGSLVAGFNAPNRVVLTHRAFAGQEFAIAIFGANGPLSLPPANYLWIRAARLRVLPTQPYGPARTPHWRDEAAGRTAIVGANATLERVSGGHTWVEGPAWDRAHGRLFFSDIPNNEVLAVVPGSAATRFLQPSGYDGAAPFAGREPGSNGLAVDAEGRLWLCQHGNRRIVRREADGTTTTIVDRFDGRRLNSPNDLLLAPNGDMYFTDPPFGLPRQFDDPARELPFGGVFRRTPDGHVTLLDDSLRGPNGLALSPDGRTLYVSDADPMAPRWLRIALDGRGMPVDREVLLDAAAWRGVRPGAPDGMKVDAAGNLFACGPGGLYLFAPDGRLLGHLDLGVATSNCCFGDDERTLFLTADHEVLALRW